MSNSSKYTVLIKTADGTQLVKMMPSSFIEGASFGEVVYLAECTGIVAAAGLPGFVEVYLNGSLFATQDRRHLAYASFRVGDICTDNFTVLCSELSRCGVPSTTVKCTCGVKFSGGICSDYCDLMRSA